jgi:hypothetical protein
MKLSLASITLVAGLVASMTEAAAKATGAHADRGKACS